MNQIMISGQNIWKSYGKLQVLKGINIEIYKSEFVAIAGVSGAGKTTLLQVLGTLTKFDAGHITINNIDISKFNDKELSRFRNHYIGFVFQFHHLLPEFTALENVCIPAFIARKPKNETINKAKEILGLLNLSHRLTHKPDELSGGEKQRVAVARALINNPAVVFADEPTGNLDSKNTQELYDYLLSLRNKYKQTFVIATHNMQLASVADRKLIIKDGIIQN